MNTKITTWIIVALVVLGAIWYAASNGFGGTASPAATNTPAATQQTTTSPSTRTAPAPAKTAAKTAGVGSLSYLLSLKQPLACTVKTTTGIVRSGTLYVANGMARLNFLTTSMIDDGTSLYVWAKGATTGVKASASVSVSGSVMASNGGVDPLTDLSFACNPWTVDASVFVPPSGVSF